MSNPLYNTNDSPNNSTQPTKAVNRQGVYVPRTHNTFDMSYFHYKTQRFGLYEPFFAMEGVPGDKIPLSSSHEVRTYPMSSPFLGELSLNKDYFMVPRQAIQPNTAEYIFINPSQGDDVPSDAHNVFPLVGDSSYSSLPFNICQGIVNLVESVKSSKDDDERFELSKKLLYYLLIGELIMSSGSLLYNLGYKLNPMFISPASSADESFPSCLSFDQVFDSIVTRLSEVSFTFGGLEYVYVNSVSTPFSFDGVTFVSLPQLLNILRNNVSDLVLSSISFDLSDFFLSSVSNLPVHDPTSGEDFKSYINMDRLIAYQLACSQFYVNPQVDFIYNAQLYRDNFYSLLKVHFNVPVSFFTYNGINVPYDYFSMKYYQSLVNPAYLETSDSLMKIYDCLRVLFGYHESLRFGDYFTDSRTRPLAIGDDSVKVEDNAVSVIDVSKSIVYQRFRNAVVKLGNNFGDYLRGIFGTSPSPDYHIPKFIAHQDFKIGGFEVANTTTDQQGNLVTNLSTRDDNFAFEVDVDMPCILIGISYFSLPRVYMQTKERFFFHRDRYDDFNPMLQYVGDQPVYNIERTDLRPENEIFGYQSRYNEYKQRYSVVSGGFANLNPLSTWTFISDSLFGVTEAVIANTQSPDYIRAHDYEFNRFFKLMSGYSFGSGFHFIVRYNNKCVCSRPMEINPNIL